MSEKKRRLGRISHIQSHRSNRTILHDMLQTLEYKNNPTHDRVTDISNIIGALTKDEEDHPHEEDEDVKWRDFYEGVKFLDDMSGMKELDKNEVIKARRLEIEYFKKMGFYKKVPREKVTEM